MPRFPRNYIETTFFHVITQGINKSYIFEYPEDIKYYIKLINHISKEENIKIIAYCIMNNHAHMLIEAHELKKLSKFMQRLNTTYGIYFNKKYNRVGYVFRNRYRSEGIYNEKQLYNCIKYIYNNPVKAGICNNAYEYAFSNYKQIPNVKDEDYKFIEVDENKNEICKAIINKYLEENDISIEDLKGNKFQLKQLILNLKEKYNISFRSISKELNISRETIRKIYNS